MIMYLCMYIYIYIYIYIYYIPDPTSALSASEPPNLQILAANPLAANPGTNILDFRGFTRAESKV